MIVNINSYTKLKSHKIASQCSSPTHNSDVKTEKIPCAIEILTNQLPCSSSTQPSLEQEFEVYCTREVNIKAHCEFQDYLTANEGHPENIKPHLDLAERGMLVSTGAERSFFGLLFSDKSDGLIVMDINPRVKAYVDFTTVLLRISQTVEKFRKLSEKLHHANYKIGLDGAIKTLSNKIVKASFSVFMKNYYLKHLNDFADIYYRTEKTWKLYDAFSECRYHLNEQQFAKLKNFAQAGNIIAITGDINDLCFLKNRKISVVDTSNISLFTMLNLVGEGEFHPRIIHTQQNVETTKYSSYIHKPLDKEEKAEFDDMLNKMVQKDPSKLSRWIATKIFFAKSTTPDKGPFNADLGPMYTHASLQFFKDYFQKNYIEVPGIGSLNLHTYDDIEKLATASFDQIEHMLKNPGITNFLLPLVEYWQVLLPDRYFIFSCLEGWNEAFKKMMHRSPSDLSIFLKTLEAHNLAIPQTVQSLIIGLYQSPGVEPVESSPME
jgi:hypothetical protein